MKDNEFVKEATEAYEQGRDAGYAVGELLRIIKNQKVEIDILIRKKKTLRDEIAEQQAEIERLQKILVGFMDEVGTWSNKYDVDISNIYKLPLLAKEDFNIKNKIKSEAYREFVGRLKWYVTESGGGISNSIMYSSLGIVGMIDIVYNELTRNLHGKQ